MSIRKVLITRPIPDKGLNLILSTPNLEVEMWPGPMPPSPPDLRARIGGVDGLYCLLTEAIDDSVLEAAGPQLKVVSQMAVGVDNIDVPACTARGIPVGHTPGVLTEATADLAMALLLGTARRLVPAANAVRAGQWRTWEPLGFTGPDVFGSTVGIVGMGRIGMAVGRRLGGFDVRLLYHNRTARDDDHQVGATYVDLETLLSESDFVLLLVALTPQTHHLMDAARLGWMKPTATLINVARGGVVDQEALLIALESGTIGYAGLDVTTPEPLPHDHPLLSQPNVTILPHIGSASIATRQRMAEMAAQNLIAGINGQRLPHLVNPAVYG